MSLINDALKNAHRKADQPRQSPVDGLALRPAELAQPPRRNLWLIPAIVGLPFALLAIVAVNFHHARKSNHGEPSLETLSVNARETTPAPPPRATTPQSVAPSAPAKAEISATHKAVERPVPAVVAVSPDPAPVAVEPGAASAMPGTGAVTQAALGATAPVAGSTPTSVAAPKPEPLRLQAIIYHPARPSALISGKTVFVGERVQGMKVVGITRETATVEANGKNLLLRLSD